MVEAGAKSQKPVLSLVTAATCMLGGYFFGDHVGEQTVAYMNFTGGTALAILIGCDVVGGVAGAFTGFMLEKYFTVKDKFFYFPKIKEARK